MYIKSDEIFLENEIVSGYISVENDKISDITKSADGEIIDLTGLKLLPGFLDIHVHGGGGFDTMDATFEAVENISKFKINEGVTSFCPTTVTASDEKTVKAIKNILDCKKRGVSGAKIIGTFLEGPFIDKKFKGAHPEEFIREIDIEKINEYINLGEGTVKSIAIAPNIKNAFEAIKFCREKNINVRVGHSGASCEEVEAAVKYGANIAIHTYNAMSGLSHRAPGFVGEVLANDGIYAEVIADLIHVAKRAIQILAKCKNDKTILVTDCMQAGGLCDGNYMLGELEVIVKNSEARLPDGTLAGSTLSMINAVKNMTKTVGIPLFDSVKMASLNPARALGISGSVGSIKIGKSADIIAIDDDFNIKFVMVDGKIKI